MKALVLFYYLLLAHNCAGQILDSPFGCRQEFECHEEDDDCDDGTSVQYDLSALWHDIGELDYNFTMTQEQRIYFFNVCGSTNMTCEGIEHPPAAVSINALTGDPDSCLFLGVFDPEVIVDEEETWILIDNRSVTTGIQISYGGGDSEACNASPPRRSVTIQIRCDVNIQGLDVQSVEFDDTSGLGCHHIISAASSSGCPVGFTPGGLSPGWIFIILLSVGVLIYLVGGCAYNFIKNGETGLGAIPNKSFWAEFPSYVSDGCRFAASCCGARDETYNPIAGASVNDAGYGASAYSSETSEPNASGYKYPS